jgi:2-methylcitrate dehydratase PrpD
MSGQVGIAGRGASGAPVLVRLAAHLAKPVARRDRERAARHVLDWLGVAARGACTPRARAFAARYRAGRERGVLGSLVLNAAAGNMLEMDDLHRDAILHPGPVIVPAALAVAEALDASGAALLDAVVRGYEAAIRIGRALGASHYRFFHNTSTAGSFGAAAAAASLLRLDRTRTAHALANAGSRTGGLWQMRHADCETKSLHNVEAAQTGVQAAYLAFHGARGPLDLLEGPQGLFAATAPAASAAEVLRDLGAGRGSHWLIHEVSFKPWPACRHAHPAIDAALALRTRCDPANVAAIELETYQSAIDFCDGVHPQDERQARFSLQHAVAVSLIDGPPWLDAFAGPARTRPDIASLRTRVRLHACQRMNARFPRHYSARLVVTHTDGRIVAHEQPDALGDPEQPMDEAALAGKAVRLLEEAGWPAPSAIAQAAWELPVAARVGSFTALWGTR